MYSDFVTSNNVDKEAKISALLHKGKGYLLLVALRYMLENNKPKLLIKHGIVIADATKATISNKNYQALIRVLGYQVKGNEKALWIVKLPLM
ncbi:MAG: hypothetical protein ACI8WB_004336 [Phenylobacterium sp.]|jgi:hypothetical protein